MGISQRELLPSSVEKPTVKVDRFRGAGQYTLETSRSYRSVRMGTKHRVLIDKDELEHVISVVFSTGVVAQKRTASFLALRRTPRAPPMDRARHDRPGPRPVDATDNHLVLPSAEEVDIATVEVVSSASLRAESKKKVTQLPPRQRLAISAQSECDLAKYQRPPQSARAPRPISKDRATCEPTRHWVRAGELWHSPDSFWH